MQTPHYPNKRRKTQVQSSHPGFQGAPAISDSVDTSNMDIRGPARPSRTAPSSRRALYPPQNTTSRRGAHPTHQQMGALHLSAEETSPEDDLVERDTNGNYIIASPGGAPVPAEIKEMEHDIGMYIFFIHFSMKNAKKSWRWKNHDCIEMRRK